jgi:hypothetical protein
MINVLNLEAIVWYSISYYCGILNNLQKKRLPKKKKKKKKKKKINDPNAGTYHFPDLVLRFPQTLHSDL